MKFGVLGFSYTHFDWFGRDVADGGTFSSNLGDNAQTIAARHVYRGLGIADDDIVLIDRDTLPDYDGPPAYLIMNGVFMDWSLPWPEQIHPIFTGFNAEEQVLRRERERLKAWEPIGCRDDRTAQLLRDLGIDAFTTGCITMCLPRRSPNRAADRLLVVYGVGAGDLPKVVKDALPERFADRTDYIFHRLTQDSFPLSAARCLETEQFEADLLQRYCDQAALIITPLLHVTSPCLGLGIPVILCRNDRDPRFSWIEKMLPLYTPDKVGAIDWNPAIPDVSHQQAAIVAIVAKAIGRPA